AVNTCISKNILVSFLERHSSEVLNMLIRGEWNMKEALAIRYEEGVEDGIDKLFDLLEKGVSLAEAKELLKKQSEK
ncbi:MAG: hypothetical protein FWF63_08960, partial [Fibromonadales bacterium]|nr:hypothetical protein [Fibromonadales bacterium]